MELSGQHSHLHPGLERTHVYSLTSFGNDGRAQIVPPAWEIQVWMYPDWIFGIDDFRESSSESSCDGPEVSSFYYLIICMIIFEINIVTFHILEASEIYKPLRYTVLYMFMSRRQKSGDPWPYGPIYVALHIIGHTFREWMRPSFFGLRRITKHSTIKRLGCIGPVRRVFRICRNSVNSTLTQISSLV